MPATNSRRQWLKQTSLAALGLGFSFRSMGNEEGIPRNFGKASGLINLGSNENPYGISPQAKSAILDMIGESNRYQFNVASLGSFKNQLASYYAVQPEQVLITPGSGEGLKLFAWHFHQGNIVCANPTFGILPGTAKKNGTQVKEIPLTKEKLHDLPAILAAIDKNTGLVYICNPANPSATMLPPQVLKDFCREAARKTVVLIDEAYLDFLVAPDNESMISLIDQYPNIAVIKTFSKIHGMAGLRVGFTIGHPSLVKKLESTYFQNTQIAVSNLTMAAAMASLKDEDHRLQSRLKNEAARQFTFESLRELNYTAYPSFTNFIFFKLNNYQGDFAADMMKKNIILRSANYPDGQWGRVSIGTREEMQKFIDILKMIRP
ncbi:MAG: aminotransferase class I/II-fold pyridoxal phosphate-dependent enzyme [Terrimonas sp.]|nr:aminotransferase class I/II-fold pyridoxal phosphate-dependent enzyme [Terrimonas sp.]